MEKLIEVTFHPETSTIRARPIDGDDGRARLLAIFLKADLQGSVESTREVIARIEEVAAGRQPNWVRNGNSFVLTLEPDQARLEDGDADEGALDVVVLPLPTLRQAVADWLQALEQNQAGGGR